MNEPNFDVIYGLYDNLDDVWMGGDKGPSTFTDYNIAQVAAQMVDSQLGQRIGRTRAKEFVGGPSRLVDEIKTRMSPLDAVKRLESSRIN